MPSDEHMRTDYAGAAWRRRAAVALLGSFYCVAVLLASLSEPFYDTAIPMSDAGTGRHGELLAEAQLETRRHLEATWFPELLGYGRLVERKYLIMEELHGDIEALVAGLSDADATIEWNNEGSAVSKGYLRLSSTLQRKVRTREGTFQLPGVRPVQGDQAGGKRCGGGGRRRRMLRG